MMKKNLILLSMCLIFAICSCNKEDDNDNSSNQTSGTFTDNRDGKAYNWKKIGNQIWMTENLAYKTDTGCWAYDNNENYVATYGYLYNWNTAKVVAPAGWHLPSESDWTELINFLGDENIAGGKMKVTGTEYWLSPNTGATNSSGFTVLPGGIRDSIGNFKYLHEYGGFWSSTETSNISAWRLYLGYDYSGIYKGSSNKLSCRAIRCIKDNSNINQDCYKTLVGNGASIIVVNSINEDISVDFIYPSYIGYGCNILAGTCHEFTVDNNYDWIVKIILEYGVIEKEVPFNLDQGEKLTINVNDSFFD